MKSLKKRRRIQILVAAAVALVLAVGLIGYGFRDGINLYRSPSQMAENPPEAGEVFRLGGLVEDGSLVRGASETVTFRVTDGGATVPVRFTGVLPDLFSEGQGMIGTGRMEGETFVASEILAKHDENYMPREVMDSLKEQGVYQEPNS
ncbi:cytochrome c maturation protein CcmE [Paracoccus sp. P2]|uniref:Cytochrome c-type biogenesis protein CcmE n=1 Tax=Paracoccus pantotrophus TaxID=82367 RepID=A0A1I5DHS3_PARPN|nr:cytochrome c maturation protein CcmE [Paracoccus pantotrophus]MDF3853956.1 cytochrome c maturation protein CcmE [Paracoccus pantotrophus]QFG35145.1 cytochrome c maturation protein CcmE [Paracoccus pantotrophus]QLH13385.1 cytochrome c maturation protein CcmE [Paracoccus pantotrophus]RDD97145.1 cytochrome c-type biogenesis protein CcmE [Paracoccus pantotrophus]RKS44670.1 cytochrome c-type biogenesis protein CcmE [Paracoccus pantotrophus]